MGGNTLAARLGYIDFRNVGVADVLLGPAGTSFAFVKQAASLLVNLSNWCGRMNVQKTSTSEERWKLDDLLDDELRQLVPPGGIGSRLLGCRQTIFIAHAAGVRLGESKKVAATRSM